MTDNTARVTVDIADDGSALIEGPDFCGHAAKVIGPRTSLNRPTYRIALTDDTADMAGGSTSVEPMAPSTRALCTAFVAAAVLAARRLAAHYGYTDVTVTTDNETAYRTT